MPIFLEHLFPALAAVLGEKNTSAVALHSRGSGPCSKVQTAGRTWINCYTNRAIRSFRQSDGLPMLCTIGRTVESAIAGVANAPVLGAPGYYRIEGAIRPQSEPPHKGLQLSDPLIFQTPRAPAVRSLVNAAAETSHVQYPRIHGTRGIEQNMSRRGFLHPRI